MTAGPHVPPGSEDHGRRWRQALRRAVLLLALAETAGLTVLVYWGLTEGSGFKIMGPIALVAAAIYALFVLPALALVWADHFLRLAAALTLILMLVALHARFG